MARNIRRSMGRVAPVALALGLGGCMVGPNYKPPRMEVPATWAGPTTAPSTMPRTASASQPSVASFRLVEVIEWWGAFEDPMLNSLVSRAVESNLDLRQAQARIRQARASRGVVGSALWPTVDASANYRRAFAGGGGSSSQGNAGGGTVSGGSTGSRDLFQTGLDAVWELDVFGGVRRGIEAAEADVVAAMEDQRGVLVSLAAEVALNYINLRGFQQQIIIANDNLKAQQRSADLTRRRFQGGFVSRLDVANAEAQVAATMSQIPSLESGAEQAIYSLSVLLGREPRALVRELTPAERIPRVPPEVPIGLPSDLLRRRPDIRLAEARVHAAAARIGVATADLFPKFSLTGSFGFSASQFKSLGNWDSRFWSVGPGVTWEIFNAGRVKWNIEVQNAIEEQAVLGYQKTVLIALQEVQNALVAYSKEQERRMALVEAVASNRQAVALATQLYTQGQTDFLNVLNAQRSLYVAEDALVGSNRTVSTNLVALYKALGGGWEKQGRAATRPAGR